MTLLRVIFYHLCKFVFVVVVVVFLYVRRVLSATVLFVSFCITPTRRNGIVPIVES